MGASIPAVVAGHLAARERYYEASGIGILGTVGGAFVGAVYGAFMPFIAPVVAVGLASYCFSAIRQRPISDLFFSTTTKKYRQPISNDT